MDDVWDDEGVQPTELKRVERVHGNAGFLEGVTASKSSAHQPGFDEGYSEGAEIGLRAGHIIGRFQAIGLHDLENACLKALEPQELFCSKYYDENARPMFSGSDHPVLLDWEARLRLLE